MTNFLQASLPTGEGIAAWAAAAGQAGAILPDRVAEVLIPNEWGNHGSQYGEADDLFDAFDVLEGVAAAARSIYREDPGHYPMPRGMEVGIAPSGDVSLVWRSDSHTIALHIGGGWSSADLERGGPNGTPHHQPDMSRSVLLIDGDHNDLAQGPRALAAMAASATLQQQGWC